MAGALETDPELQSKFVSGLLRLAAMGALGGAAARTGMAALRNTNPRYNPPEPARPIVVDMPYPTTEPVLGVPETDPRREKQVGQAKYASPIPPAPLPPVPATPAPSVSSLGVVSDAPPPMSTGIGPPNPTPLAFQLPTPGAAPAVSPAAVPGSAKLASWLAEWMDRNIPYEHPLGNEGAKMPGDVPAYYAAGIPLAVGGAGLGYTVADKILRAADRRRASSDLDEAQKEYQTAIMQRLADSHLPAKAAAEANPTDPYAQAIRKSLGEAFDIIKEAAEGEDTGGASARLLARAAFPGLWMGPTGAVANMALSGTLAGLGGYAGYNAARSDDSVAKIRRAIRHIDRENATAVPAPLLARLVPVERK